MNWTWRVWIFPPLPFATWTRFVSVRWRQTTSSIWVRPFWICSPKITSCWMSKLKIRWARDGWTVSTIECVQRAQWVQWVNLSIQTLATTPISNRAKSESHIIITSSIVGVGCKTTVCLLYLMWSYFGSFEKIKVENRVRIMGVFYQQWHRLTTSNACSNDTRTIGAGAKLDVT